MELNEALSELEPFLSLEKKEQVALVRLGNDILRIGDSATSINALRQLLDYLAGSAVDAVVLVSSPRCFSPERCDEFWRELRGSNGRGGPANSPLNLWQKGQLGREKNAFGALLRWLRTVPKPVVMTFQGDVALPFLGIALACDYRVVSDGTVFHNRCQELGVPPGLGLIWLLPAYVGFGRASAILTRATKIEATGALRLGLVDEVVEPGRVQTAALDAAREVSTCCPALVGSVKRLLNIHLPDLRTYLDQELREIEHAINAVPPEKPIRT